MRRPKLLNNLADFCHLGEKHGEMKIQSLMHTFSSEGPVHKNQSTWVVKNSDNSQE